MKSSHFFLKVSKNSLHLVSNYEAKGHSVSSLHLCGNITTEAENGSVHVKY